MQGRPLNRAPFRIAVTEGRIQPFAVWRANEVWFFTDSENSALDFITNRLRWEAR